jgi:hypothetical protein
MLNEIEFAEVAAIYTKCMQSTKDFRQREGIPLERPTMAERFRPVRDAYERLTGTRESNEIAIMHHRLSLYGPPCRHCKRPLRSPKAKLCGACMLPVGES